MSVESDGASDQRRPSGDNAEVRAPQQLLSVALNSLRWLAADEVMSKLLGKEAPSAENLLDFLRGPFARASLDECVARYRRASTVDGRLFAIPAHERLSRILLSPLHNAKAEFILGHYLSCIGLCGVVSEVLCVLRLDAAEVRFGDGPLDDAKQKDLWGRTFGRLPHGQRIGVLRALGLIDDATRSRLQTIAATRNKYMHIYGQAAGSEERDAFDVYGTSCEVVVDILGLGLQESSLVLHPDIVRFLQK
ncbi:MAG TPA: hypothetical protein VK550_16090 [Polyangiaceae bacterium]|nr:hypothetical protein [Polyangiaceae bacterium]